MKYFTYLTRVPFKLYIIKQRKSEISDLQTVKFAVFLQYEYFRHALILKGLKMTGNIDIDIDKGVN